MGIKITKEVFIDRCNVVHNFKYDYSKVMFNTLKDKVCIGCPIHGEFLQIANAHINKKHGCKECSKKIILQASIANKYTTEQFIDKAKLIHSNKYTYDNINYVNAITKVPITCSIHGIFLQQPRSHLNGNGCPQCAKVNNNYWSYSGWKKAGENSVHFAGFKVYIIKLWNNNEVFYKIGKTYNPVYMRFNKCQLPYSYRILDLIEGSADYICKLEQQLLNHNKTTAYTPCLPFAGMGECFSSIDTKGILNGEN